MQTACTARNKHNLQAIPACVQAAPIVRVAVEAALPSELPQLVEGLRLLNRADPFLEVTLQDKGEYVLGAAGMSCPQWPERFGLWVS